MTITEFVLARIAEDEGKAREILRPWRSDHAGSERYELTYYGFMADPAHVLAECEAKRRIVERCRWTEEWPERANDMELTAHWEADMDTLRDLASIYAEHPDFDPAWKASR